MYTACTLATPVPAVYMLATFMYAGGMLASAQRLKSSNAFFSFLRVPSPLLSASAYANEPQPCPVSANY